MNLRLGPFRLYSHHLGKYMRRWILQHPLGTIRLHNIRMPDKDDVMHDHPWHFASLILKGGYSESKPIPGGCPAHGPFQTLRYTAGAINFCPADGVHRISEIHGESCWTIVVSTRPVRSFGFWREEGDGAAFVPWREWVSVQEKDWTAEEYEARLRAVGAVE